MRIVGEINVDIETDRDITEAQFEEFQRKLNALCEDWCLALDDMAAECGFESDSMHSMVPGMMVLYEDDVEDDDDE